jgi:hypothetical protein
VVLGLDMRFLGRKWRKKKYWENKDFAISYFPFLFELELLDNPIPWLLSV